MNNKEIINKIKTNDKKIEELTKQRNKTMREILKLYENERRNKE